MHTPINEGFNGSPKIDGLCWLASGAIAASIIYLAIIAPIYPDSALNMLAAKLLWVDDSTARSVGPSLLLLSAFAIELAGAQTWLPSVVMATINLLLFGGLVYQFSRSRRKHLAALSCFCLLGFLLIYRHDLWLRLHGDMFASLMFLNAVLLFGENIQLRHTQRIMLLAGALSGLAIAAQVYVAFSAIGLLIYTLWLAKQQTGLVRRQTLRALSWFVISMSAAIAACYSTLPSSTEPLRDVLGVKTLMTAQDASHHIVQTSVINIESLISKGDTNGLPLLFFTAAATIWGLWRLLQRSNLDSVSITTSILLWCGALHMGWLVFLSQAPVSVARLSLLSILCFYLALLGSSGRYRIILLALCINLFLLHNTPSVVHQQLVDDLRGENFMAGFNASAAATAQFVDYTTLSSPVTRCRGDQPFAVEYLVDIEERLPDCLNVIAEELNAQAYPHRLRPPLFFHMVKTKYYSGLAEKQDSILKYVSDRCDDPVFESTWHTVYRCRIGRLSHELRQSAADQLGSTAS